MHLHFRGPLKLLFSFLIMYILNSLSINDSDIALIQIPSF